KYLIGVSIVLASICYYYDIDLENNYLIQDIKKIISCSPIADIEYKASSTNMKNMILYLFIKNKIQDNKFESLNLKRDKIKEINTLVMNNDGYLNEQTRLLEIY
ncbi:TPA: DUF262 domain-containing protein, partial [Clostridioides difficile]|nr:DUF262 domain-containing protein [Clostridioides difficile]